VSRIPRSAATIIPYDVESRVRVLAERHAAKVAAATAPPGAGTPAPESAPKAHGLLKGRTPEEANGRRPAAADAAADAPSAVPGITPIGSLTGPGRATVEGRIRVVEIKPVERNSVLACEISDGTGELTAMFYGRSHIPGIVCSARVRLKGSVGIRADGHPVMINPAYELLFPAL